MYEFVIIALILFCLGQNLFWMKICYDLNAKLMSRSYYEYEQAKALKYPTTQQHQTVHDEPDYDAERQARDFNSLMGMGT